LHTRDFQIHIAFSSFTQQYEDKIVETTNDDPSHHSLLHRRCIDMERVGIFRKVFVIVVCLPTVSSFFVCPQPEQQHAGKRRAPVPTTRMHLVPVARLSDDFTFLTETDEYRCSIDREGRLRNDSEIYDLCLVEEKDLPDLSRFIIEGFGADAIRLSSDTSSLERLLMQPAVELVNGYSGIIAFAEVLSGMRSRMKKRMATRMDVSPPPLEGLSRSQKLDIASSTSVVLALAKKRENSDKEIDVIGTVELRLQPCDAKIPFSLPWLDRVERRLASVIGIDENTARDLQPYLSNLCVDEGYRGKRIGRALVRCVENIASSSWGYTRMYLHVDVDNKPALELYKSEGYCDVGLRWNPFWAGKAATIGYFVKKLEQTESREETGYQAAVTEQGSQL
jgi:ribosomal protein S18 acetylase RimI-like enzyme